MGSWKTWSVVWNKMVVKEGLRRTWPHWTIRRRRASGSISVELLDVMKKGKCMFNPRNQARHEESHITKCQSLLNQDMKWLGDQKWKLTIRCEVLQVATSKSKCQRKIKCDNPHRVKKRWSGKIQYYANSRWRSYFIFNLEYRLPLYQEGYHMDCQQSLNAHIA
jgi:hypothetical protein